jgi:hypothetical protein
MPPAVHPLHPLRHLDFPITVLPEDNP